jgi:hypothetical protein
MVSDSARKKAIRKRMDATGEGYTTAARAVAEQPQIHMFRPNRMTVDPAYRGWKGSEPTCLVRGCWKEAQDPAHWIGGQMPPKEWRGTAAPTLLSTFRQGDDGPRVVQVLSAATGAVLASTSVPWRPADELIAQYEADGLLSRIGDSVRAGLDRPDLVAHRLGYSGILEWQEWPDGSWRTSGWPMTRRHLVTAAPLNPRTRQLGAILVRAYPGAETVVDELIDPIDPEDRRLLDQALDQLGYTVDRWETLPGGVRYGAALPGRLAERDWWRLARVRIIRETTVGAVDPRGSRTFRVGEEVTMNQRGRAGGEVLRDSWWSSTDIDGAHIIAADCAEIVEILEDIPPTWAEAALSAEQITALLAGHHDGAAAAAVAWIAAGLHVAHGHGGLDIRTAAPQRRLVGQIRRDYWQGNQFVKPYEVVVAEGKEWNNRRLDALPLDPVAATEHLDDAPTF